MRLILTFSLLLLLLTFNFAIAVDKIIGIAGNIPLSAEDEIIKARIEKLGFVLEPHSQNEAQPVSIAGAAGVYIFETISSGNIVGLYKNIPIPFITAETYILDEMQLAADNHKHDIAGQTSVVIVDPKHQMAAGLNGEIKIAPSDVWIMATCAPGGDVQIVAKSKVTDCVCLAGYEKGAKDMAGNALPARRVITFISRNSAPIMTAEGWRLFDNSILWGMGREKSAVSPEGTAATTWGILKYRKDL
jgi:hypothetical protein